MNVFLKLCFDLGCYLSVVVFYAALGEPRQPLPAAVLLLFASALIYGLWSSRRGPSRLLRGILPLLVLAGTLLFRPSRQDFLLLAPFLAYHFFAMHSGRCAADEDGFLRSCRFAAIALSLLFLPGILFPERVLIALEAAAPWLCTAIFSAIALNRLLRLHGEAKGKEYLLLLLFAALCAACAFIRLPSLLWQAVVLLWNYLLQPILELMLLLFGIVLYLLFVLINLIFKIDDSPGAFPNLSVASAAEQMGLDETLEEVRANPWIRYLLLGIGIVLLSLILWRFFRRFLGVEAQRDKEAAVLSERELPPSRPLRRFGFLRPSDPRDAVRFYFDKFLREARRRGAELKPSMTGEELVAASQAVFPETDAEALKELWLPARYSSAPVSREQAAAAAALWKKLKKSE